MIVSAPTGAFVAEQRPIPADKVAVQRSVEPEVKATVPVGVPAAEDTVTLYITGCPCLTDTGLTDMAVEVGEGLAVIGVVVVVVVGGGGGGAPPPLLA